MRCERREHHDAAGRGLYWNGVVERIEARQSEWANRMLERADAVDSGGYPRTTVVEGGIGEGHPAGEVLLGLDVCVAVVLVPRKVAVWLGLFVDGLVPVHAHVVADEIAGHAE